MGNSDVAVLHYDHSDEIGLGLPRMRAAMRDFPGMSKPAHFGCGAIVSWDHSSGYQVVVVHGNAGWRIGMNECPPPDDYLEACAKALRSHGWRVEKPKT